MDWGKRNARQPAVPLGQVEPDLQTANQSRVQNSLLHKVLHRVSDVMLVAVHTIQRETMNHRTAVVLQGPRIFPEQIQTAQ